MLDLGSGSRVHARRAIEDGAAAVDVVDISPEMLRIRKDVEAQLGRSGHIGWLEADATQPLTAQIGDHLHPGGYDVVMANWLFDHATCVRNLRAMWENVVTHLKPGGRFIGVRVRSVQAAYIQDGKYGMGFDNIERIPTSPWSWPRRSSTHRMQDSIVPLVAW